MSKVWVLVAVAAVALLVSPVFMAMAADTGAGDQGGAAKGKGKGNFAPVTVTDEQATKLKPKVEGVTTAAKALDTEAKKILGDTDGPRYTMQILMEAVRAANPAPAATDSAGKGKGKGGMMGEPLAPTAEQMKTLTPLVEGVNKAVKDLNTEAKTVLGDTDGPRYTQQSMRTVMRELNPNMGGGKRGGGKGGNGGGGAGA